MSTAGSVRSGKDTPFGLRGAELPPTDQSSGVKAALVPLSTTKTLVIESRKNEGLDVLASHPETFYNFLTDIPFCWR